MRKIAFIIALLTVSPMFGATHRYWRVYVPATTGAGLVSCAELELHATVGGANIATGGTAAASSVNTGKPASNCFDGSTSTYWESNVAIPQWISYDLTAGAPNTVEEIKWTSRNDASTENPTDIVIQYSDDNTNWTTKWSQYGISGWTNGAAKTFTEVQLLSVSKAQAETSTFPPGLSVSKSQAEVSSFPPGLSVSKSVVFVVLLSGGNIARHQAQIY